MDAALLTAIAALVPTPATAAAAMYSTRGANRAAQVANQAAHENGDLTGYDSLTTKLIPIDRQTQRPT
ncbi:hypothetical protein [Streptomyces sp. NPDC005731]|uniref:hypothetical protein n=1 Tax=Streptomyces sp. NPDC005731 TaxID=3157056 RepID=UPI0033CED609